MTDHVAIPRVRLVEWARLLEQLGEDARLPQNVRDVLLENSGSIAYFAQAKAHECPMPTEVPLGSYSDRPAPQPLELAVRAWISKMHGQDWSVYPLEYGAGMASAVEAVAQLLEERKSTWPT